MINSADGDLLEDTELWMEQGKTFLLGHSPNKAIKYFDKVLAVEPNNTRALANKAIGLLNLGEREEAISVVNSILEIDPQHVDALVIKGDELLRNGQLEEGYSVYETVLEIKENNSKAHSAFGDKLSALGKFDEALMHYKIALENFPEGLDFEGKSFAEKVLEMEPDNIDALNSKGKSLVHLGRSEEGFTVIVEDELDSAILLFDKVLEKDPENSEALFNKGRTIVQKSYLVKDNLEKETMFEEGLDQVRKVLEMDPNHVGSLNYLGDRLVGLNKTQEGMQYLDKALQIDPDDIHTQFAKASALGKEKRYDEAVFYYDNILNENPFHRLSVVNFKSIAHNKLGYKQVDGFLDVKVHDSNGALAIHLRSPKIELLKHDISDILLDEWNVVGTKIINGTDFEILQFERSANVNAIQMYGGAKHYGISYQFHRDLWKLYSNYWFYNVDKGDTVTFTYTVFRQI